MVRKALQAAKEAPLDLKFNEKTTQMARTDFFEAVGKRMGYWRSLTVNLQSRDWCFVLEDMETSMAPNLEQLRLLGHFGAEESRSSVSLFGGASAPPRLKELSLACIPINLTSLRLGGLRSLTLESIPEISSSDILNACINSPLLESLWLESLVGLQDTSGHMNHSFIQLPSLIYLSLTDLPIPFLNLMLSIVVAPQLRSLYVGCDFQGHSTTQLFAVGMGNHITTISDVQTFDVTFENGGYEITIGKFRIGFNMDELAISHFQETFDWISDRLGRSLKELPLHLDLTNCEPELSYLEWFTRRATVTTLTLYSNPYSGTALELIIPFLSRPTTSDPVTWLLPDVETFSTNLVWDRGNPDILDMIAKRHSAHKGHDLATVTPKPFREIWLAYGGKGRIPHPNMEFLKEVQRVGQGAVVYWEREKLAPISS
ncbi:hypothetical protein FRC04_011400 [Tulasnella sp. 424]|nr:hypothetical protein FRC04_011400 [Tulasnella sp. 424]